MAMPKEVTHEMLAAAMKKAVETGLVAKGTVDTETYMKTWEAMKASIKTALYDVKSNAQRKTMAMPKEVTHEMLAAAMKKAVETGLVAKGTVDTETYMKTWEAMKASIKTALDAADCLLAAQKRF